MKRIGILALQGAFAEHKKMLETLCADCAEIRQRADLNDTLNGIVLPGGESTVMGKLLHELDLFEHLKKMIAGGLPVFGTCAGLILLAKKIAGGDTVHLGLMDITAQRNAYGRQLGSFSTQAEFAQIGVVPMTFIRAPLITEASKNVEVLAQVNGQIVAARQNNMLVASFHPELTSDTRIHAYFLNLC
jgi:pyridoxal 5'-phosphate synthase pdxT subunit